MIYRSGAAHYTFLSAVTSMALYDPRWPIYTPESRDQPSVAQACLGTVDRQVLPGCLDAALALAP